MPEADSDTLRLDDADALARKVADVGAEIGLPYVAAAADIGSPEPMANSEGEAYAETIFQWIDPKLQYWKDRSFALRAAFVHAARTCSEPFYFRDGTYGSWRQIEALEVVSRNEEYETFRVQSAIVSPIHAPGGAIGTVVWASDQDVDVSQLFARDADRLHALALRFVSTYHDARAKGPVSPPVYLTRREIQCLKWAAAGKTDAEISAIMEIAVPTVRFHITNAAEKLGVSGKARAIQRATNLGYIGQS